MPANHPHLPVVDGLQPVPVYDCHVIVSGPDDAGRLHGRVTTLPGLSADAGTERDLLRRLAEDFKRALQGYRERGETVPWVERPEKPAPGERQRWIPVHL